MIGSLIGDVVGSTFEFHKWKYKENFELFSNDSTYTDDSVLTVATADCILNNKDFTKTYQWYARNFINRGYGGMFRRWIDTDNPQPYNSFGNGSAMRVSPIGFAYDTLEETLEMAKRSAEVTHNHIEGIKGAQAVASAIFLARKGSTKEEIKDYIQKTFEYNLDRTIAEIKPTYSFNETCQGSVPEAIICFLESTDYESCIRLAVSLCGDADTQACIAGGIAQAFYKNIPYSMITETLNRLDDRMIKITSDFTIKYNLYIEQLQG